MLEGIEMYYGKWVFSIFILLFVLPALCSSQEPLWTKDFGPVVTGAILSENGDLVGVNLKNGFKFYLLDGNGNEKFNGSGNIGFYNYSNSWFYCKYPKIYFYDNGVEKQREVEISGERCVSKVIDNYAKESSYNMTEVLVTSGGILDSDGKIMDYDRNFTFYEAKNEYFTVPINPLALINDTVFSAGLIENAMEFAKLRFKISGGGWSPIGLDHWGYGLGGDGLSVDMSKDGNLIAGGSEDNYVYLFNSSGDLLWKYKTSGDVYKVFITKGTKENNIVAVSRDGFFYKFDENGNILAKGAVSGNVEAVSKDGAYVRIIPDSQGIENRGIGYYKTNFSRKRIVVLANSIDKNLCEGTLDSIENMEIIYAIPDDFENYKNEENILIIGGPQAYEGVGEIVKEALSGEEENSIIGGVNEGLFIKKDVWKSGQSVFIAGGKDRVETKRILKENKNRIEV
jgi:hypothetical protein